MKACQGPKKELRETTAESVIANVFPGEREEEEEEGRGAVASNVRLGNGAVHPESQAASVLRLFIENKQTRTLPVAT